MPELRLVFDCQDMPKDVKDYFFQYYGEGKSNDVYIDVWIEGDCDGQCPDASCDCDVCGKRKYDLVEQWLLENGASTEETAIVKRWW